MLLYGSYIVLGHYLAYLRRIIPISPVLSDFRKFHELLRIPPGGYGFYNPLGAEMFIRGIGVDFPHHRNEDGVSPDENRQQVCFPKDLAAWRSSLEASLSDHGHVRWGLGSTGSPNTVALVIGHPDKIELPCAALDDRTALGFIVTLPTLRQMRGAIDAAIASLE